MKTILLAAAAVIAMPAIAQTTTTPTTTPTQDQSGTMQNGQTMPAQSPQADQTMPAPAGQAAPDAAMPAQSGQAMQGAQTTGDPAGGYSPQAMSNAGPPAPGQTVTYQQAPSPNEAFPPPAAQTGTLPYCKAGQYDNCREHSTASGARKHRARR